MIVQMVYQLVYCLSEIDVRIHISRTNLGRARAWMRLALMQKLLAEQVQTFIEERKNMKYVIYVLVFLEGTLLDCLSYSVGRAIDVQLMVENPTLVIFI